MLTFVAALLADTSSVSATSPWWGNGLFTILGAVFGGLVTAVAGFLAQERKASRDERLAREERDRKNDSVRANIEAALLELDGYFGIARGRCVVDVIKWQRAIDRVQWADKTELAGAFDRRQSRELILTINKCEACFESLSRLPSNPWDRRPLACEEERTRDVTDYIGAVRGTIQEAERSLNSLLITLECRTETPEAWQVPTTEIIQHFRRRSDRLAGFAPLNTGDTRAPDTL